MNPRRRDACPNVKFVPERKSEAYRYEQKPMQMGKSEAQRLIEAAQILRDAKQIASKAILKGLIKLPTRMIEL